MKTPSSELQDLIKALLPGERKAFLAYSKGKKSPDDTEYIKLFNCYCSDEVTDDKVISQNYQFKNFTRIKNYLHQQLLNYLAEKSDTGVEKDINTMIAVSNVLMKRALYKQGISLLNKARNLAEKHEFLHHCLLIDQKLYVANNTTLNFEYWDYFVHDYPREEFNPIIERLQKEHEILISNGRVHLIQSSDDGLLRKQGSLKELDELYAPLLQKGEDYAPTFQSKIQYYTTIGFYYMHRDIEKAIYYCEKSLELIESKQEFYNQVYVKQIVCMGNLLLLYALTRKMDKMRELLDRVMNISTLNKSHKNLILETYVLFETGYCKINSDYPLRKKVIRKIDHDFKKYTSFFSRSRLFMIASNLSFNYFQDQKYKQSLEWLNRMDELQDRSTEKNVIIVHRLFRLILYYEMDKIDLLQYSINNVYRHLQYHKRLFPFEKIIIKMLENLIDKDSNKSKIKILEAAHEEINKLQQKESLKFILELFNFHTWIKTKIDTKKPHRVRAVDDVLVS